MDLTEHKENFLCACYGCRKWKGNRYVHLEQEKVPIAAFTGEVPKEMKLNKQEYELVKWRKGDDFYFTYEKEQRP